MTEEQLLAPAFGPDFGIECARESAAAFGNAVRETPGLIELDESERAELAGYAKWLAEMAQEIKDRCAWAKANGRPNLALALVRVQLSVEETGEFTEALAGHDLAAAFNELLDISYVTDGHYHTLGLQHLKLPGYAELHRANMSKLVDGKPLISPAGRHMKGPDYRKPDLKRVLEIGA